MTGLYNDAHASRLKQFEEGTGNLLREPFLNLKSPRKHINYPSDLGETNDLASRDVPDVHLALLAWSRLMGTVAWLYLSKEWHKVVLAERKEFNSLHKYHLFVVFVEDGAIQDSV